MPHSHLTMCDIKKGSRYVGGRQWKGILCRQHRKDTEILMNCPIGNILRQLIKHLGVIDEIDYRWYFASIFWGISWMNNSLWCHANTAVRRGGVGGAFVSRAASSQSGWLLSRPEEQRQEAKYRQEPITVRAAAVWTACLRLARARLLIRCSVRPR